MTFFGNTLIDKGLISKSDLVNALIQQSSALPSPAKVCLEKGLMDADSILEGITMRGPGDNFKCSCKRLGSWTDEINAAIIEEQTKLKTPLGQILVNNFGVDISVISDELNQSEPSLEVPTGKNDEFSYEFTFPKVSGETKKQYLDFFSQEVKDHLEQGFNTITQEDHDPDKFASLEEVIQQLSAAASFARMEVSFKMCESLTQIMTILAEEGVSNLGTNEAVQSACIKTLDVLWELHRFIEISGSEQEFWANNVSQSNFRSSMVAMSDLLTQGAAS